MLELTALQRIERLRAAGERIMHRFIANPVLLTEPALCQLSERITHLMLKIAQRQADAFADDDEDYDPYDDGEDDEDPLGDDWGWLEELSGEWDEDEDIHP